MVGHGCLAYRMCRWRVNMIMLSDSTLGDAAGCNERLIDTHFGFGAIPFPSEARHFIELTKCLVATALPAITDDFETMPIQFWDGVELLC